MLTTSALDLLKTYYGYEQFRHPQEDIIHDLVAGQDLLVLMPTGGGEIFMLSNSLITALRRRYRCFTFNCINGRSSSRFDCIGHSSFLL